MQNETAQSAKRAKFFNFLGELRGLGGSKLLSDINLRKPWLNASAHLTQSLLKKIINLS